MVKIVLFVVCIIAVNLTLSDDNIALSTSPSSTSSTAATIEVTAGAREAPAATVTASATPEAPTEFDDCNQNYSQICVLNKNCDSLRTQATHSHKFMKLQHIRQSQSALHLVRLKFYVIGRAGGDCRVILSPVLQPHYERDRIYEFLIGGSNNMRTIIRKRQVMRDASTPDVLSETKPVEFQINISLNGEISIFRNNKLLTTAFDRNPLEVKYVSFGTFQPHCMDYFYNCHDKNGNNHDDQSGSFEDLDTIMAPVAITALSNANGNPFELFDVRSRTLSAQCFLFLFSILYPIIFI